MVKTDGSSRKYIGYRAADRETPWAKYFREEMPPIQTRAAAALEKSPAAAGALPPLAEAAKLSDAGYAEIENGYTLETDGSIRVAILTEMPRVAPEMWDWWFGWHGCRDDRYKLWHPRAHKAARWQDGGDATGYVGRTSIIQEYIGGNLAKADIRFLPPADLGINPPKDDVFICARVGYTNFPLDFGWLLHQVRAAAGGAEMRSRFWFGGAHIEIRSAGILPRTVSKILRKTVPVPEQKARDLLIHCAEEMNHLAKFLPEIYAEFSGENYK